MLGMFTWDESSVDPNHREIDTEISRWGEPAGKNAQYLVQPYYVPRRMVVRFSAPAGRLTHSFRWEPGRVSFKTIRQLIQQPSRRTHIYIGSSVTGRRSSAFEPVRLRQ